MGLSDCSPEDEELLANSSLSIYTPSLVIREPPCRNTRRSYALYRFYYCLEFLYSSEIISSSLIGGIWRICICLALLEWKNFADFALLLLGLLFISMVSSVAYISLLPSSGMPSLLLVPHVNDFDSSTTPCAWGLDPSVSARWSSFLQTCWFNSGSNRTDSAAFWRF